ncbi:MAG: gluconate:H+ symporter [Bryobacterales bacterium]|nr:gluconate:H+ symporter [Bryobacterales bacterium]MDE0627463.1 gluconate:H+ symporter [Bryobacterales bacterium]
MQLDPLVILVIAVAVVFVLILRLRINAFIALITAATTVGLLSPNVPLGEVMPSVAREFGGVCGSIAIVIALAALIGQCLMESGAADKIVRVFVRALGEKRASLSLLSSGYVLSVPVFFDTVFYLLVPLARAMRVRMGKNYLLFLMAICAGGAVTHSMVPPTPGPLAMAATLKIDLGVMILVGAVIAVPMSIAGWLFGILRDRQLDVPLRETPGLTLEELDALAKRQEARLPSFFMAMLPIVLPVVLIASNTLAGAVGAAAGVQAVTGFLGNPNLALLASAAISLAVLARQKGYTLAQLAKPVETALASGGLIILITAGGGSFGKMLVQAGVGKTIGDMSQEFGVPILMLSFLLGTLLKIAQGSGTVAMITVSSIMAPLVIDTPPGFHAVYVACAIGSGSLVGSWMNDSGFWVYKQMSGLTEKEALQTWTPLLAVMGVVGYIVTQIAAILVPLA